MSHAAVPSLPRCANSIMSRYPGTLLNFTVPAEFARDRRHGFTATAARSDERLATGQLAVEKFAVGQSVPRKEDPMLLRGKGHYTDDVSLPGQAYAVMVRSQHRAWRHPRDRHRRRRRKMPGVLGVYTGADL